MARPTTVELLKYFLYLGSLGFGGPVALVGYMYRDLVEKRRWISESDYKEGLALAQLMPGPLAARRTCGGRASAWRGAHVRRSRPRGGARTIRSS